MITAAFSPPNFLPRHLRDLRVSRRPRTASLLPTCALSATPPRASPSRRAVLRGCTAAVFAALLAPRAASADAAAAARAEGLRTAAMCVRVLGPVDRYVREGAWDRARTNVNYCSRVLAVKKRMVAAAEAMEKDEDYLVAMEAAAEVTQLLTVADTSVYTAVFIPSDEGVNPEQRQYQRAAFAALDEARSYLSKFLEIYGEAEVGKAMDMASKARYEIRVEDP